MAKLTEYLEPETLEQLASAFSQAAGRAVRILSADGEILAGSGEPAPRASKRQAAAVESPSARIMLGREHVGSIVLPGRPAGVEDVRMLGLMQDVVIRLCQQGRQLRHRIEELAAMYRLTEVFTGRMDLKEVHQLAAETMLKVTGADACSIRVLSEDRTELLTMAEAGLSPRYMSKGPILLADSKIDRQVLETGQCVYVADERSDPRVLYPAEARREGIVSALCAPMSYRDRVEGIIRVYTKRPHEFDWFETSLIRGVAAQAAAAIVNARLYNERLAAENMRRQLRLAGEVQRRMIPAGPPKLDGLEIAAIYEPCFELGGDFYDFIELPQGNLGVAVADVVGKGVRASLLMASVRSALRAFADRFYELSRVLSAVNVHMYQQSQPGDFLTLFYGVIDVPNRRLTYVRAGHEPALLLRGGQARPLVGSTGGVIGMDPDMRFEHAVEPLQSGDALVICTDGLPEAVDFHDEPFGIQRVREAALAAWGRGDSAEAMGKHLLWEMRRFAGLQTRRDDLTLVTIKVQ